jgi:hypothetical protein
VAFQTPPQQHWRSYGADPLPTAAEAMNEPLAAFPSWFLRIECDRCGKVQMVNEAHARWRDRTLRAILARIRHDGCGGLAGKAELLSGIEGVSSRPVRKIVLIARSSDTATDDRYLPPSPSKQGRARPHTMRCRWSW